jgi:hypothetical protein
MPRDRVAQHEQLIVLLKRWSLAEMDGDSQIKWMAGGRFPSSIGRPVLGSVDLPPSPHLLLRSQRCGTFWAAVKAMKRIAE